MAALLLSIGYLPSPTSAQEFYDSPEWNAVMQAADMLEEGYVIPNTASELASMLRSRAAEFAELGDTEEFVEVVNAAMRDIANDLHLRVFTADGDSGPRMVRRRADSGDQVPEGAQRVARRRPSGNADGESRLQFASATIESRMLSDDVGYLRVSFLYLTESDKQALREAMEAIEQAEVIVLDMRGVPGGVEEAVMHLSGYFFGESTHLVTTQRRGQPEIERWSDPSVSGPTFANQPLFILTSGRTGSAAESFVFGMEATARATTVGEKTAGAGHFGNIVDLGGGYQMFLPMGRTFNPRTGIGFEAQGISPDVSVPADQALNAALIEAGHPELVVETPASDVAEEGLKDYVGQYGPRSVTLSRGRLRYQREGMPGTVPMEMIAEDEFELVIPAGAQVRGAVNGEFPTIRFNRSQSGSVESLSIVDPDGSVRETSPRE